jgi:hypothetical protein
VTHKPSSRNLLAELFHELVCAIELGILTHVDGSNESPHDGEHPHPWPCERVAQRIRDRNLNLSPANWRGDLPNRFWLDPETGDVWPLKEDS